MQRLPDCDNRAVIAHGSLCSRTIPEFVPPEKILASGRADHPLSQLKEEEGEAPSAQKAVGYRSFPILGKTPANTPTPTQAAYGKMRQRGDASHGKMCVFSFLGIIRKLAEAPGRIWLVAEEGPTTSSHLTDSKRFLLGLRWKIPPSIPQLVLALSRVRSAAMRFGQSSARRSPRTLATD